MIGEEYHDSVVNVLKRQVFVHISSELDRYEGILGRSACTNIGTKVYEDPDLWFFYVN